MAFLLLGGVLLLQAGRPTDVLRPPLVGITIILATITLLTLVYWLLIRRVRHLQLFAYQQVVSDIVLESLLLYLTGAEESLFTSVYNLSIISGSILLYKKGGVLCAVLSSALYGGILTLRFLSFLPPFSGSSSKSSVVSGSDLLFTLLINITAFFVVAILSSYLSEQARVSKERLQSTQSDLTRLAALHDHILQCLPSGLITCDLQGKIAFANEAASLITGIPKQEICGMSLQSLFPELPPNLLPEACQGIQGPKFRRQIMKFVKRDGHRMQLGFSLAPLKDGSGAPVGIILHFQDVTETVAMEEHLRKVDRLASVGEMAARMAHEIRNPLASVSGSIQVLQKELHLDGANKRLMEIVVRETNRLNGLLTDFLSFARPEESYPTAVDLSKLLRETASLFMERVKGEFDMEVQVQDGLLVEVDSKRVRQIVWNLLNNALEAMPEGGTVSLNTRWGSGPFPPGLEKRVPWIVIEITDTGPGIPEEIMDKIFDPFFTTKEKGTGLGLSIVHRLVEEMGGRVEVHSVLGQGSTFTVWLPAGPLASRKDVPLFQSSPSEGIL